MPKPTRTIVFVPSTKQSPDLAFSPVGALTKAIQPKAKRKRKAKPAPVAKPKRAKVEPAPAPKAKRTKAIAQPPAPAPVRKPRAAKPAPLPKLERWPDGRHKASAGDEVYQVGSGFGGLPAVRHGVVYAGRRGKLRVRVTGGQSLLAADMGEGKTYAYGPAWTMKNDPEIARREELRRKAERNAADARKAAERDAARRLEVFTRRYGTLAIADVKPGDVLVHYEGRLRAIVKGVEEVVGEPHVIGRYADDEPGIERCITTEKGLRAWRKLPVAGAGTFHLVKAPSGIIHVYRDAFSARQAIEKSGGESRGTVTAADYFDAVAQARALEQAEYPTIDARMRGMAMLKRA